MSSSLPPCMGGWCSRRDHCLLFHHARRGGFGRQEPSERLCAPGFDGELLHPRNMSLVQVPIASHQSPADPVEVL